uniref:Uncharacterized protein n=1 Tax=Daphnia magna TaxID=35525 RepID=A0A0P5VHY7_9CRUS
MVGQELKVAITATVIFIVPLFFYAPDEAKCTETWFRGLGLMASMGAETQNHCDTGNW